MQRRMQAVLLAALALVPIALVPASEASAEHWRRIWGPVDRFLQNDTGEYAVKLPEKDIYERITDRDGGWEWRKIGGPGKTFVVTQHKLYGLTPSGDAVYEYTGTPLEWRRIGGPARDLYAGGGGLFATNPQTGDLWAYELNYYDPGSDRFHPGWTKVGGPGAMFAVGGWNQPYHYPLLYGLTPNKDAVWQYKTPMEWTKIGGPAEHIYASGKAVYATDPESGDIFGFQVSVYEQLPQSTWVRLGGPGRQFDVYTLPHKLYAVGTDRKVWRFNSADGPTGSWEKVGEPGSPKFDRVYVGPVFSVRAREKDTKTLWSLEPGDPPRRPPGR